MNDIISVNCELWNDKKKKESIIFNLISTSNCWKWTIRIQVRSPNFFSEYIIMQASEIRL